MKVLYLVSGIGPPAGWGTEFIQNLIFELSKKGVHATIINPIYRHTHPEWQDWVKKQEKKFKVRIIPLEAPGWIKERLLLHFGLTPIFVTWIVIKLLRTQQFDLIHEFSSIPVILFRHFIFRLLGVPTIFTLSVYNNTILGKMLWFKFLNFANLYLIPSHALINKIKSLGVSRKKLVYSPPGINLEPFVKKINKLKARRRLRLPPDKFIISYFGSLTTEKGVQDIISAVKLINNNIRRHLLIVLYVVWKGSREHQSISTRIRSLNVPYLRLEEKYVDIPVLLAASDAVVFPQITGHGTTIPPISVIEAIASKTFVITTRTIGNDELINKNTGELIPSENPVILAKTIEEVYSKRKIPKDNVMRTTLATFSIERSVQLHLKLYNSILAFNSSFFGSGNKEPTK